MYQHQEIEKKWRKKWEEDNLYRTKEELGKPKYYILDMFPYPSGLGLHVGHPKGYIATDVYARMKMMQGYNVLHPMGFDAFGLPAENYAIKNKVNPMVAVKESVARFKGQLSILGFSYDWEREINTTDPKYYKWTQWIFLQMWKNGLAYQSHEPINWCPSCLTGLANEDLEGGKCERCGSEIEKKPLRQWVLRITDYADRLLADLDKLPEWEESTKEMQRNWIGRSEGAEINFKIKGDLGEVTVFTTRVDTIFGCTYLVLAPEHEMVNKLKLEIDNEGEVDKYIASLKSVSEEDRLSAHREKTGVKLNGIKAINPFNQEEVDVFIADYVLSSYGTGAVMAVPAHDERDYDFAKKYGLRIKAVIKSKQDNNYEGKEAMIEEGVLFDSGEFSGLSSQTAKGDMATWLEKQGLGKSKVNYRLKDWVFSRQRYWGEPIPLIHCEKCGVVPVNEEDLPVKLPEVESYEPTGTGESPLAAISDWVNTPCPKCGASAKRETNTMPQWAGSCWYYLRYIDVNNDQALVDSQKEAYWSPVDFYVGGAEHATRHLIYARFWHKFLYDIKAVSHEEPFVKLKHVGLIIGEDGRKMSKRWGNVINPSEVVEQYGADALRLYEMFMGPFEQAISWNSQGLVGAKKFLDKVYDLVLKSVESESNNNLKALLHKTIKKVGEDISAFRFNTAVSTMMILANELSDAFKKSGQMALSKQDMLIFIQLLSSFAPHLSEEMWALLGEKKSVFKSSWPEYDSELIKDKVVNLAVQINGKLRAQIEVESDINEEDAFNKSLEDEKVKKWLEGKEIVKKVFVPGRLLNIVIK